MTQRSNTGSASTADRNAPPAAPPRPPSGTEGSKAPAKGTSDGPPGGLVEQARGAAGQVVEQTQHAAGQVVDQAKEQATSQLAGQKERAVDGLGVVAQAIRQTGQELRKQDQEAVGRYADTAAQQVERFTGYLRGRDVPALLRDLEGLARRQPALFLGGSVALGALGARFLMSSGEREERRRRYLEGMVDTTAGSRTPSPPRPAASGSERPEPLTDGAPGAPWGGRPVSPITAESSLDGRGAGSPVDVAHARDSGSTGSTAGMSGTARPGPAGA